MLIAYKRKLKQLLKRNLLGVVIVKNIKVKFISTLSIISLFTGNQNILPICLFIMGESTKIMLFEDFVNVCDRVPKLSNLAG
jgi:hypothetical protein